MKAKVRERVEFSFQIVLPESLENCGGVAETFARGATRTLQTLKDFANSINSGHATLRAVRASDTGRRWTFLVDVVKK